MSIRITLRLSASVLRAARRKAIESCRSLDAYVEMLIRRDLNTAPRLEVIAPDDIQEYESVPLSGESQAERRFRDALFNAILESGTCSRRKR